MQNTFSRSVKMNFEEAWEIYVKLSDGEVAPDSMLKNIGQALFNAGMEHAADIVRSHTSCISAPYLSVMIGKKISKATEDAETAEVA